ncbi:hypothetical protein [Dickeya poaceiphila]|uniref:Uncharacterized protein n=1 Tax=Dickeya poaceiphila TaxID=568768 RepID=A0A5B8I4K1_9GAMM|nr:hypothetical protein [Dickeya poaceiphila]QDX29523.1 hypothetical protein Dpoa569_0001298 [Dickeya poaceiphila]
MQIELNEFEQDELTQLITCFFQDGFESEHLESVLKRLTQDEDAEPYVCPKCGGVGWSAGCDECIPY